MKFLILFTLISISSLLISLILLGFNRKPGLQEREIPLLGGLSFIIPILIALIALRILFSYHIPGLPFFVLSASLLAISGISDDRFRLSPLVKLGLQILSVSPLIIFFVLFSDSNPLMLDRSVSALLKVFLLLFWYLLFINAANLFDGMDGLLATQGLLLFAALSVISGKFSGMIPFLICSMMVFSIGPFLAFNLPPAKIYMGDTGSMFIGFMTATVPFWFANQSPSANPLFLVCLLFAFPLFELANTVFRRWKDKRVVFMGDRYHLHHQLWGRFGKRKAFGIYSVFLFSLSASITILFITCQKPFFWSLLLLILHFVLMMALLLAKGCKPWNCAESPDLSGK